ncbi:MAG: hydrogenase maturation protease [Thermochromatium sp.]
MAKTLIIGYGNPIRGDDAIGPLAIERLVERGLPVGVDAIARHGLTAELVTELVAYQRAIFIDAVTSGEPGTVQARRLEPEVQARSTIAHVLDPSELLAWCRQLYGQTPETYLITVAGACFDYAYYQLSPVVEAALERLLEQVERVWADEGYRLTV